MMRASAMAGFWTLPPQVPECRSTSGPVTSIWVYSRPRRPTVMAGWLPSKKPGVADDREVRIEPVAVRLQPGVEVGRPGLLLALEHVADVDGQAALGLQPGARGPQVEMDLALVVRRAAREDAAVLDARLERRPHPQVERIDRLDVVVAVDEDRRRALGVQPVGVHDRMAVGGARPRRAPGPSASSRSATNVGRRDHVGAVLRERPDAGDAQEVDVVVQPLARGALEEGVDASRSGRSWRGAVLSVDWQHTARH